VTTRGVAVRGRLGLGAPRRAKAPVGVLVLGMHRSGTSAATSLVGALGLATCRAGDQVRGPWNPRGHYESRSLMHFNNALLAQAGRTWWYPPPSGDAYAPVLSAVTVSRRRARRVFYETHRRAPWVWKDPRTCVLLPFWRAALGPRLAAVVVFRDPHEVAASLRRRHGLSLSFGAALWQRYNRLVLAHVGGMPVLVTRYDDLVADPLGWSALVRDLLVGCGMQLGPAPAEDLVCGLVDPALRHPSDDGGPPDASPGTAPGTAPVHEVLQQTLGAHTRFSVPAVAPEPPEVEEILAQLGPGQRPGWNPPPAVDEGGVRLRGGEGLA
jgi:hypothetical protein